jgi:alkylation response protein AidB-like acyl-CoA dehydrogenase
MTGGGMRSSPERMQDNLYHDLFLPEETLDIRKRIREFARDEVAPHAYEIGQQEESKESFPRSIFQKLAKAGFFKAPFPKEVGGMGLQYPTCSSAVILEELAYVSNSIAVLFDVHSLLTGHALLRGTDFIREKYLWSIMEGDLIGCFATTEPSASSELSAKSLQTTASRRGDTYVVNGHKRFITNAPVADIVLTLVNMEGKLSLLVIELDSPGCRVGEPDKKTGNRGQLTSDIYFKEVEVPVRNLIGDEGKGRHIALSTLTRGRIGIGASSVGMAQSAFDECVSYMKQREAYGKKIAQFQYWQYRMAERAVQIENARNLCYKAALRVDQGVEFPEPEAAGAKYYSTECAVDMARDAVQIFGGYGYVRSLAHDGSTYKVEEIYRDCKIAEIYEGANEIQKWIISRSIFGKEFTG